MNLIDKVHSYHGNISKEELEKMSTRKLLALLHPIDRERYQKENGGVNQSDAEITMPKNEEEEY